MHINDHINELAQELVGNWRKFSSFEWDNSNLPYADDCAIITLSHRDSDLLTLSNESVILRELAPYMAVDDPDDDTCWRETHGCWAYGHRNAIVIRVYDNAHQITAAFAVYAKSAITMADYPYLDEEDYVRREDECLYDNVIQTCRNVINHIDDCELEAEDVAGNVKSWLWDNEQCECDSPESHCCSEASVKRALVALGLIKDENVEENDDDN